MYEGGMANMRYSISNTAEYGDYTRGPRIVTEETKAEMKRVLEDIQSGRFARDWVTECRAGQPSFKAMRRRSAQHSIEEVRAKLRGLMPSITANQLVHNANNKFFIRPPTADVQTSAPHKRPSRATKYLLAR